MTAPSCRSNAGTGRVRRRNGVALQNQIHVTAIVKATFAFAHDAAMARTASQEILPADIHHGNNPGGACGSDDIAPYLPAPTCSSPGTLRP